MVYFPELRAAARVVKEAADRDAAKKKAAKDVAKEPEDKITEGAEKRPEVDESGAE